MEKLTLKKLEYQLQCNVGDLSIRIDKLQEKQGQDYDFLRKQNCNRMDSINALEKDVGTLDAKISKLAYWIDEVINNKTTDCPICKKIFLESVKQRDFKYLVYRRDHPDKKVTHIKIKETVYYSESYIKICPDCAKKESWKLYERLMEINA